MIPRIEPMKAATVDEEKEATLLNNTVWLAEEKLNGARYMLHFEDEGNKLYSNSLSTKAATKGMPIDKAANVPHITGKIFPELNNTVIDGEIVGSKIGFNYATSIMGSLPAKAIANQKASGWATFKVWDILYLEGKDLQKLPLMVRKAHLKDVLKRINNPHIVLVDHVITKKWELYEKVVSVGGEGAVLKDPRSLYWPGGRDAADWVKVKKTKTWDVVIMGYTDPDPTTEKTDGSISANKNFARGWIRALVIGVYDNGKLVEVGHCSGFDDATREEFSLHKSKYLGQAIEVKGQEITKANAITNPRWVQLRSDLDPLTCTLEKLISQK